MAVKKRVETLKEELSKIQESSDDKDIVFNSDKLRAIFEESSLKGDNIGEIIIAAYLDIIKERTFDNIDKAIDVAINSKYIQYPIIRDELLGILSNYDGVLNRDELQKILSESDMNKKSKSAMIDVLSGYQLSKDKFDGLFEKIMDKMEGVKSRNSKGNNPTINKYLENNLIFETLRKILRKSDDGQIYTADELQKILFESDLDVVSINAMIKVLARRSLHESEIYTLYTEIMETIRRMLTVHNETRFEKARIVGARALQISMGAPVLITYPSTMLDPIDVALLEYDAGVLPISVKYE